MIQLFTVLFFGFVLGTAVAIIWSVIAENLEAVRSNLPWKAQVSRPPIRTLARTARSY